MKEKHSTKPRPYKVGYGYDSHRFLTTEEKKDLAKRKESIETETDLITVNKPLIIEGSNWKNLFKNYMVP